jgi:hypothetical protein
MYMYYYAIWNAQLCISIINYATATSNSATAMQSQSTGSRQQLQMSNVYAVLRIFFTSLAVYAAPGSRLQAMAMQNAIGRIQNADTDHTAHRGAVWTGPLGPRAISISIPAAYCLLLLQIAARAAKKGLGPQLAIGLLAFPFASCRTVCRADC